MYKHNRNIAGLMQMKIRSCLPSSEGSRIQSKSDSVAYGMQNVTNQLQIRAWHNIHMKFMTSVISAIYK